MVLTWSCEKGRSRKCKEITHLSKITIIVGSDIDATSSNTDISEYYAITISSISRYNGTFAISKILNN